MPQCVPPREPAQLAALSQIVTTHRSQVLAQTAARMVATTNVQLSLAKLRSLRGHYVPRNLTPRQVPVLCRANPRVTQRNAV